MVFREKTSTARTTTSIASANAWPREIDMILSAMDMGGSRTHDRRGFGRSSHRTIARLRFFSDHAHDDPWLLYTRDFSPRGIGFITDHLLPLGYGGEVELLSPQGNLIHAPCTLSRCREAVNGWYEGALNFNREQNGIAF